jgi:hypothetical protein
MKEAFDIVEKAMIVRRIYSSASLEIPLIENQKKSPKLLFLDTGLVNYALGVREELFTTEELNNVFQGQIAEQAVGQALQILANAKKYEFAYWFRDKKNAIAEIDFLIQFKSRIYPIEVKSGKDGRLKSLHLFMSESNTPLAVRIHAGNLIIQDIQRPDGSFFRLISLPFYLIYHLEDILASIPI